MVLQRVAPNERGRVVAFISGGFNVGHGVGTFALGAVATGYGYGTTFVVAAAAAATAWGLFGWVRGAERWSAAGPTG